MAWFMQKISITHDTRLALTTEAAGAMSGSGHWLCVYKQLTNAHSSSLWDVWRCSEIFLIVMTWGCKTNPRQRKIK